MLPAERRRRILEELRTAGQLDVPTLAATFEVSKSTIRRDLNKLHSKGMLHRVRGGTLDAAHSRVEPTQSSRHAPHSPHDALQIGRAGANLVRDGDSVLIDSGTTAASLASALYGRRLTVLTASLSVVDILRLSEPTELIVLGGVLRRSQLSFAGAITEETLRPLHATIAFMGTSGIRDDMSVMDATGAEAPHPSSLLAHAHSTYLLAAADKFPGTGVVRVAHVRDFTGLITTYRGPLLTELKTHTKVIHV